MASLTTDIRKASPGTEQAALRHHLEGVRAWYLAEIHNLKGDLTPGKQEKAASVELDFTLANEIPVELYDAVLEVNGKRVAHGPLSRFLRTTNPRHLAFAFMMDGGVVKDIDLIITPAENNPNNEAKVRSLHVGNLSIQPDASTSKEGAATFRFDLEETGIYLASREVKVSEDGAKVLNTICSRLKREAEWVQGILLVEYLGDENLQECSERLENLIESLYPHFRGSESLSFDEVEWIVEVFTSLANARSLLPVDVPIEDTLDLIGLCDSGDETDEDD